MCSPTCWRSTAAIHKARSLPMSRRALPRTARIQLHARERGKINNTTSALARFTRDIGYRIKKLLKPNEHTYGIEWIYGHDVTAGTRAKEPAEAA